MAQNNSTAKVISILDYIGILWILGLFIEKDDPDVKFHTNQGLILFLLEVVTGVFSVLSVIPILGIVFTLAGGLLGIVCLVLAILGIVNAAQGLQKPLPGHRYPVQLYQIRRADNQKHSRRSNCCAGCVSMGK